MERSNKRKIQKGVVISNKMQNTVVVRVKRTMAHPRYGKVIERAKKLYAHCEGEVLPVGTVVTLAETRPLSKLKRWRVLEEQAG